MIPEVLYSIFMSKGRIEAQVQTQPSEPVYIDTAYKHLHRQDIKAQSLKNRIKLLQYDKDKVFKQKQNNQLKLDKLQTIRQSYEKDNKKLERAKQKIDQQREGFFKQNLEKREYHQKQMKTIKENHSMQKHQVRQCIKRLRSQHKEQIQASKEAQLKKKQEMRNKIQESIAASRVTIKNFFDAKQSLILQRNKQEVKILNKRKAQIQLDSIAQGGNVQTQKQQIKKLKDQLYLKSAVITPHPYENSLSRLEHKSIL